MRITLTALYEPVDGGWTQARIEELPGVITAGQTLEEARELLLDALREYLLSLGEGVEPAAPQHAKRETLELVVNA